MGEIPKTCYRCGEPLVYVPSSPNQLEEGRPIIKWVCNKCFKKYNLKSNEVKEK